ncbi:MAG: HD-GYP domain-containing protein, partial [Kamptonema sp. SIO4C4]|nr:HD-GYP domain-containing protein [Kamptonema sp. SIO4C4]
MTKQGPLDEVERESLRQHPLRGGRLLSGFDPLRGVAEAIRHQHEKWDGTGFPQGLRAERIPFAA